MKKIFFLFFVFFLFKSNAQQNLVLDPSFEDDFGTLACNFYFDGEVLPLNNWETPSEASPDLLSLTLPTNCILNPMHPFQNLAPITGDNYIKLVSSNTNNYREYARGNLSETLQVGTTYRVQFYASLATGSNSGMNNIGVAFINNSESFYSLNTNIPLVPQVNYSNEPFITQGEWILMAFDFVPTANDLDAFIIGNFYSDNETNFQFVNEQPFPLNVVSLLIEDVAVFSLTSIIGIENEICQGDEFILPNILENGIEGTWIPPTPNSQETTTYIFTPNISDFPPVEFTIVVNPKIIPEFDEIGPFCDEFPDFIELPKISNNGIEGIWSPNFNLYQTTTYTFTPNEEYCAETITKKIIIDEIPKFEAIPPFCDIDLNFSLPTVSTNGISGIWTPEFDPFNSQTYRFIRGSGDCMQEVTLDVVIYPQLNFDLVHFCDKSEYFVQINAVNFELSEITDIKWVINDVLVFESGSKINLSSYSSLLEGINSVEVFFYDVNGCLHTNLVQLSGEYICKIQKGISPNGDGLNEYFDLVSFGGVDLKIFNRYGSVVYENSNYKNEWKGQSNSGKQLPTGTYFYVIKTKIGEEFSGYIQLTY